MKRPRTDEDNWNSEDDEESSDEEIPDPEDGEAYHGFKLLNIYRDLCPTIVDATIGRRRFRRKHNPNPQCRVCYHKLKDHESRSGRDRLCPISESTPRGNCYKRLHTDRDDHVCKLCERPRKEHKSGADAFNALLCEAVLKNEATLRKCQDARDSWVTSD